MQDRRLGDHRLGFAGHQLGAHLLDRHGVAGHHAAGAPPTSSARVLSTTASPPSIARTRRSVGSWRSSCNRYIIVSRTRMLIGPSVPESDELPGADGERERAEHGARAARAAAPRRSSAPAARKAGIRCRAANGSVSIVETRNVATSSAAAKTASARPAAASAAARSAARRASPLAS